MYSTLPETGSASITSMIGLEARRFARHPLFILGALAAYGVQLWLFFLHEEYTSDLLSEPIIPAFFIGLASLIVAARLTASTDVSVETMGTAPQTEARRTLAVAGASAVVPLLAGLVWLAEFSVLHALKPPHAAELWFGELNGAFVVSILLALGVVSCVGGALLGVLAGRWLHFPGAPVVAVVALVVLNMAGTLPYAYGDASRFRLWAPWAMFHSGTMSDGKTFEGIPGYAQAVLPGNPVWYLLYLLALCVLAVGGAVWHDRTARTARLRTTLYGVIALAAVLLGLAMFTGIDEVLISEPLAFLLDKS